MSKILIIDDDEELCELVSEYLSVEGFTTESVHDGEKGLEMALSGAYEMAILDVMLPRKNGFDVLRDLRKTSKLPVLMLTAKGDDMERIVGLEIGADDYLPKPFNPRELVARLRAVLRDLRKTSKLPVLMLTAKGDDMERIVGLEIGADDYLPKPFNPRELVARLRAVLRRVQNNDENKQVSAETFMVEDIEVSLTGRSAKINGADVNLTAVEFDLLVALLEQAGKVIKKEDLSKRVLDRRLSPFDRSLDMHVSNLRKKIGLRPDKSERIKTIRSVGYIYTVV